MTTLGRHHGARGPVSAEAPERAGVRVLARWRVSALALAASGVGVVETGERGVDRDAVLEVKLWREGAGWMGAAWLCGAGVDREVFGARGVSVTWVAEAGLDHVESAGLLVCTVVCGGEGPVYARTPLLRAMGLAGGRYELLGVEAERA